MGDPAWREGRGLGVASSKGVKATLAWQPDWGMGRPSGAATPGSRRTAYGPRGEGSCLRERPGSGRAAWAAGAGRPVAVPPLPALGLAPEAAARRVLERQARRGRGRGGDATGEEPPAPRAGGGVCAEPPPGRGPTGGPAPPRASAAAACPGLTWVSYGVGSYCAGSSGANNLPESRRPASPFGDRNLVPHPRLVGPQS